MHSPHGCLTLAAILALMLLLVAGPSKCSCSRATGLKEDVTAWFKSLTGRKLPPSKTEQLQQQWQQVQASLMGALKEVPLATSADAGLARFKQAVEPGVAALKDARRIATDAASAAAELRKQKEFYANAANEALLPAEVRPQLDQALAEHIAALDRLSAEINTLSRQLDSMGETLARHAATCQVQAKLSGEAAAKALWADKAAQVIAGWK